MQHDLWVKADILPLYGRGKDLEVRLETGWFNQIKPGQFVRINGRNSYVYMVRKVRRYPNFESMLKVENPERISPGCGGAKELLFRLRGLYPARQKRAAVLVFEFVPAGRPS